MNDARLLLAHFSPTGTTLKAARSIAQGIGYPICEIDLSAPVDVLSAQDGDVLLVAVPVFGGRVPGVALERLALIKGSKQPSVAVVIYGNRAYDDALLELKEALDYNGFCVVAAGAFIAEHSIVRHIAANRPDEADLKAAEIFGADAKSILAHGGNYGSVTIPGNHPYREYKGLAFHPGAGQTCVQCGQCAKLCPVGAILKGNPSNTNTERCITCMRCVTVCPQMARTLPAPALLGASAMLKLSASERKLPEVFFPQ